MRLIAALLVIVIVVASGWGEPSPLLAWCERVSQDPPAWYCHH
jgi:hypothetical protein